MSTFEVQAERKESIKETERGSEGSQRRAMPWTPPEEKIPKRQNAAQSYEERVGTPQPHLLSLKPALTEHRNALHCYVCNLDVIHPLSLKTTSNFIFFGLQYQFPLYSHFSPCVFLLPLREQFEKRIKISRKLKES